MLRLRDLTGEERESVKRVSPSRTAAARLVERAKIVALAAQGARVPAIAQELPLNQRTVRLWLMRFNAAGLEG